MDYTTNKIKTESIGQIVDEMMASAKDSRKSFERKWYDNNFFDDGYHFRYLSRLQNKIIDLSSNQSIYNPLRAIPKASKQIRGVANLLLAQDLTPVVYPERINKTAYPSIPSVDPETGQQTMQENPEYRQALEEAKKIAKLSGHWIEEEFKEKNILDKLAYMILLTGKHYISYLKIWPDAVAEKIKIAVRDAFDIYTMGDVVDLQEEPFLIDGVKMRIAEIKANELFDKKQLEKINPDNKFASSEIKEAYMISRFGRQHEIEQTATLILKEAYIKEYINKDNIDKIRKQEDGEEILKYKEEGEAVIRQVFVAGNIWLKDTYLKLNKYPYVDYRMEPGPMYGVSLIERFIPANKSLDITSSRIERYTNTMPLGAIVKPKSEGNLDISNKPAGQIIEYTAVPPTQFTQAPLPASIFQFLSFITTLIEEQGLSTTTLGKIPTGVKAHAAIESLKESEYASLVVASRRLKTTVKQIAEQFLYLADSYFVTPKSVYYLEKGEPQYFDIIGKSALKKREELKIETGEGIVPIDKDCHVDIEIQSGPAFTREGKREAAKSMLADLFPFLEAGLIPPEAFKVMVEKYMEMTQFGATSEFMEAMDKAGVEGMTEQQVQAMKVALIEVMADLHKQGVLPSSEQRIEEGKIATAQALVDTGVTEKEVQRDPLEEAKGEQELQQSQEKHQMVMKGTKQKQDLEVIKAMADMKMKAEMVKNQKKGGQSEKRNDGE